MGRLAAIARVRDGAEPAAWADAIDQQIREGRLPGRLWWSEERPAGFVSWSAPGMLGVSVRLAYVEPAADRPAEYGRLLDAVRREAGPIVLVHGPLPGLAPDEQRSVLADRGYRPCSRSEMVREGAHPLPEPQLSAGERLRPVRATDTEALAELHRRAYHRRFDRYLFVETEDEAEDARREVAQLREGRYGPFEPLGSAVLEKDGKIVAAVLSVSTGAGTLVADVMVSPELQGGGLGRKVLSHAVRSVESAQGARTYLNVTEGNERAVRLYRSLGFVRSLGPSHDWYDAHQIPVGPAG